MNKFTLFTLLALNVFSYSAFSASRECVSTKNANIKVSVTTDGFEVEDYAGPAFVEISGLKSEFNVKSEATYMRAENNGGNLFIIVPLKSESEGQLLIVFKNKTGTKASVQHISAQDDYSVLAQITCK